MKQYPVIEVFKNNSEVSSTLLGVDRAEEQLSLFADVSTYGLDRSNWNYYTVGDGKIPYGWYHRDNPIFGKRGFAEFHEETSEQALYLKSFPVQYTYPDHPNGTEEIPEGQSNFGKYIRFIALGRWLYEIWIDVNPRFAEDNFLNDSVAIIREDNSQYEVTKASWSVSAGSNGGWVSESTMRNVVYGVNGYSGQDAFDQIEKWTLFYFKIQNDEEVYPPYTVQNGAQTVTYPFKTDRPVGDLAFRPQYVGEYQPIQTYSRADFTRPGGSPFNSTVGVIESKKTFRYQPGRVSGFTFGLRLRNNPREQSDKIEWGCANDTDQYMFQVTGSQWNIIRRSTQRIPDSVLENNLGMNLVPADEYRTPTTDLIPDADGRRSEPQQPPGRDKSEDMYEVRIPRAKWNGDPLNGSGQSGYIADLETVTMYKIEFSWYGAIGAKFYAYVPIGNGEARWVLLHTWIIENQLETPALQAADFKFRYVIFNRNTSNLIEPSFIYKYGSSYYIDGGDEGNVTFSSTTSDSRLFSRSISNPSPRGAVIALHPKARILNSFGYDPENENYQGITNNKKVYPLTLAAISDENVRIDIVKVTTSSDGQHGAKSVSLAASDRFEKNVAFTFFNRTALNFRDPTDTVFPYTPAEPLTALDVDAKLIGSGLSNVYLRLRGTGLATDPTTADLQRRYDDQYNLRSAEISERVNLNGLTDVIDISSGDDTNLFTAKLISMNRSIVASDTPIEANRFKIHFLNPFNNDPSFATHTNSADFSIGVTGERPTEGFENNIGYLKFGDNKRVYPVDPSDDDPIEYGDYFNFRNELSVDWAKNRYIRFITNMAELREVDSGIGRRFEQDYRVRESVDKPFNGRYGNSSCIQGSVSTVSYQIEQIDEPPLNTPGNPQGYSPGGSQKRVIFLGDSETPPVSGKTVGTAEIGVNGVATGYVFTTIPQSPLGLEPPQTVAYIDKRDSNVPDFDFSAVTAVDAKIVTLSDDNKISKADPQKDFSVSEIYKFNVQPLYMFVAMNSHARINNIIVEEFSETSNSTHVPNFIGIAGQGAAPGIDAQGDFKRGLESQQINTIFEESNTQFNVQGSESSNIVVVKDVQVTTDRAPSNFTSKDRLSGIRFDTQTDLPLADGQELYSFYVGKDEAVDFGLENIFNIDRNTITPGLFNNEAYYFRATPVAEDGNVSVQMTLTCKEQ